MTFLHLYIQQLPPLGQVLADVFFAVHHVVLQPMRVLLLNGKYEREPHVYLAQAGFHLHHPYYQNLFDVISESMHGLSVAVNIQAELRQPVDRLRAYEPGQQKLLK